MSATGTSVAVATESDLAEVTDTLVAAFDAGPVADWLISDQKTRTPIYREYFAMVAQHALSGAAVVEMIPGAGAVALWYPARGGEPRLVPDNYQAQLAKITGAYLARFLAMDEVMHLAHLRQPHWYLGFLAVVPQQQNRGHGTRLLNHRHRELDRSAEPSFLIASSADSARLYTRRDYRPTTTGVHLPDGGPPMFPLGRRVSLAMSASIPANPARATEPPYWPQDQP
jgi:GNAT superfamily N-acetyltransferase